MNFHEIPTPKAPLPDPDRSCAFTGHRTLTEEQGRICRRLLEQLIPRLVRGGVDRFIAGGALGFDTLAAETLLRLRDRDHLPLSLEIAVPCVGQDARWSPAHRARYRQILSEADYVTVLAQEYYSGCMQARNRYMVDRASRLIAFYDRSKQTGGTAMTVEYAEKTGRNLFNLTDFFPKGDFS